MQELKEEGLVTAIGVAGGDLGAMNRYVDLGVFDVLLNHNRFTLLDQSASPLITKAVEIGMTYLNAAPYASGLLAKPLGTLRDTSTASARGGDPADRTAEGVCDSHGVELAALALQFSTRDPSHLHDRGVSTPTGCASSSPTVRPDSRRGVGRPRRSPSAEASASGRDSAHWHAVAGRRTDTRWPARRTRRPPSQAGPRRMRDAAIRPVRANSPHAARIGAPASTSDSAPCGARSGAGAHAVGFGNSSARSMAWAGPMRLPAGRPSNRATCTRAPDLAAAGRTGDRPGVDGTGHRPDESEADHRPDHRLRRHRPEPRRELEEEGRLLGRRAHEHVESRRLPSPAPATSCSGGSERAGTGG